MNRIIDQVRALGSTFSPALVEQSMALYAAIQPTIDENHVRRDLSYGPDPRHRVNLFGAAPGKRKPVLVFLHGGGFVAGDRGGAGAPFYNNIGGWAARQGWLAMVASYRLAPAHMWPDGADDVARLVAWIRDHGPAYGGDRDHIILMGQSAGAAHIASFMSVHRPAKGLAATILLSGLYDVARADRNRFQDAYFGTDPALFPRQSSLDAFGNSALPCLLTVAENDPPDFQRQAAWAVAARVEAQGRWPEFHQLAGHNHISPVLQIGSEQDELGPILATFIRKIAPSP